MAITRGVSWMGLASLGAIAGWPLSASRWLRMAPHDDAAGDHTTGRGPSALSSQPLASALAARPEDLLFTLTKTQLPLLLASALPLKLRASAVSRSPFSGEVAMLTWTHPLPLPPVADGDFDAVHAASDMARRRTRLRLISGPPLVLWVIARRFAALLPTEREGLISSPRATVAAGRRAHPRKAGRSG